MATGRQRLGDELLGLFAAKRFAGLFITHSVAEAVYLSTRVVVMSGRPGRITHSVDVPFGPERDPEIGGRVGVPRCELEGLE